MPSRDPHIVALRGSPEYRRFLDELSAAVRAKGVPLKPGPNPLAEHAIAELAARHKVPVPTRSQPIGTNRFGVPGKEKP